MIPVLKDVLACLSVWVLVAFLALALAGCAEGDEADAQKPTVVAAVYPLAWAVEQLRGDTVEVVNLTPPGGEPHDVELSPRDVEAIRDAALVLYVGSGFQPAVEDAIESRDGPSFDLLRGQQSDPHLWLDPIRFAGAVEKIAERLGRAGSAHGLIRRIESLDEEYRSGLARCARRALVTSHASFGYLVARYRLTELSLSGVSPESEPSPRELERLVDDVRASGATTVFAEPLVSDRLAVTVAREAGLDVAVLDPIESLSEDRIDAGEDYLSVMRDNLASLRRALGCR